MKTPEKVEEMAEFLKDKLYQGFTFELDSEEYGINKQKPPKIYFLKGINAHDEESLIFLLSNSWVSKTDYKIIMNNAEGSFPGNVASIFYKSEEMFFRNKFDTSKTRLKSEKNNSSLQHINKEELKNMAILSPAQLFEQSRHYETTEGKLPIIFYKPMTKTDYTKAIEIYTFSPIRREFQKFANANSKNRFIPDKPTRITDKITVYNNKITPLEKIDYDAKHLDILEMTGQNI